MISEASGGLRASPALNVGLETIVRNLYILIATVLSLISAFSFPDVLLPVFFAGAIMLIRPFVMSRGSLYSKTSFVVVWVMLDAAMFSWPVCVRQIHGIVSLDNYSEMAYYTLCSCLIFFGLLTLTLRAFMRKKNPTIWGVPDLGYLPFWVMVLVILVACVMSFLSWRLGIDIMGTDSRVLPYKLNGVILYYKQMVVPIMFIVLADYFHTHKNFRLFLFLIVFFFFWNVVESVLRLSKGQILYYYVAPLTIWFFVRRSISITRLLVVFVIFGAIGLFLNELNAFREAENNLVTANDDISLIIDKRSDNTVTERIYAIVKRVFREGVGVEEIIVYDVRYNFFYNRIFEILPYETPTKYKTYVILGANPNARNYASGMSLMTEAYFVGGAALVFITYALVAVLTILIDNNRFLYILRYPGCKAAIIYVLYTFLFSGVWTNILNGLPAIVFPLVIISLELFYRFHVRRSEPAFNHP